jgi:tyrosinase
MAQDTIDNSKEASPSSRYQRVKEILNNAAGESCPSYQGYGRFWNLPLAEFLEVAIYGIRMIAPVQDDSPRHEAGRSPIAQPHTSSCCHAEAPSEPPSATTEDSCCSTPSANGGKKNPGRGAASGLIKGLRGEYPFDGSQFPRLPWGGEPVSASDIQFISDWIDDGCPGDDEKRSAIEVHESLTAARARGDEEHPLSPRTTNQHRHDSGVIKARKNVSYLPADELQRFRDVITEMHKYDKYFQDERGFNYWARIHANSCQHGWEEFLTWHRLYLYHFEQQMQDVDPSVTLPYWDWTDSLDISDQADVQASILDMRATQPLDNGIIPIPYRCWVTESAIKNLKKT